MPTYEYRCRSCGATFESRRAIADSDAKIACPSGHVDAARAISTFVATKPGGAASIGLASRDGLWARLFMRRRSLNYGADRGPNDGREDVVKDV